MSSASGQQEKYFVQLPVSKKVNCSTSGQQKSTLFSFRSPKSILFSFRSAKMCFFQLPVSKKVLCSASGQ